MRVELAGPVNDAAFGRGDAAPNISVRASGCVLLIGSCLQLKVLVSSNNGDLLASLLQSQTFFAGCLACACASCLVFLAQSAQQDFANRGFRKTLADLDLTWHFELG